MRAKAPPSARASRQSGMTDQLVLLKSWPQAMHPLYMTGARQLVHLGMRGHETMSGCRLRQRGHSPRCLPMSGQCTLRRGPAWQRGHIIGTGVRIALLVKICTLT